MTHLLSRAHGIVVGVMLLLAALPNATAAPGAADTPFAAPIFVRGSFNAWDTTHNMTFDAKSASYVMQIELGPGDYEFKVASEDWSTVNLGPAGDPHVQLGVPAPMVTNYSDANMLLEIVDPGAYTFRLDTSDMDHLTMLVERAHAAGRLALTPPFPIPIFLRGSFNGWSLDHKMTFDGWANAYVAQLMLYDGTYEFKIADEYWYFANFGAADDGIVELGIPEPVAWVDYANLSVQIQEPGVYSFTLDTSDLSNVKVVVRPENSGSYTLIGTTDAFFECLGNGGQWVSAYTELKGVYHYQATRSGTVHYTDHGQLDGTAVDESGRDYQLHGSYSSVVTAVPSGGSTYTEITNIPMISTGAAPNLFVKWRMKETVNANGTVTHEIFLQDYGCSR
jgi:hypothetical protein